MGLTTKETFPRLARIRFELIPCQMLPDEMILEYYEEFKAYGEDCYVLYLLNEMTPKEWKDILEEDTRTQCVAFMVNKKLAGIGRITLRLNHPESGMFGYAIRPTMRGHGFASKFIILATEAVKATGLRSFNACVDTNNFKSLRAFDRAGWQATGQVYKWDDGRDAIELVPTDLY